MDINHITLLNGPQKVAPFSHAVRAGNLLFITGQMPTLKNNKTMKPLKKELTKKVFIKII